MSHHSIKMRSIVIVFVFHIGRAYCMDTMEIDNADLRNVRPVSSEHSPQAEHVLFRAINDICSPIVKAQELEQLPHAVHASPVKNQNPVDNLADQLEAMQIVDEDVMSD